MASELVDRVYSGQIQLILRPYVPLGTREIGNTQQACLTVSIGVTQICIQQKHPKVANPLATKQVLICSINKLDAGHSDARVKIVILPVINVDPQSGFLPLFRPDCGADICLEK